MSDAEIEVETVSGYSALPKDVVSEIGTIKLFNKWSYAGEQFRLLTLS